MRLRTSLRYESVPSEPGRFWIRHAPRVWPGPPGWWLDLARAEPAGEAFRRMDASWPRDIVFEDVVYLPPVEAGFELLHDEVVGRCSDQGLPLVQQILPGDQLPVGAGLVVVDLTDDLLHQRIGDRVIPAGSWAAWPVIPGLTDGEGLRRRGLDALEAHGVAGVMPIAVSLDPVQRRELAELGSAASYGEIFHGDQVAALRELTKEIGARGLSVLPEQPPLGGARRPANRSLAAHFSMLAELWLRCGRPEGRAHMFFRAARRLEAEPTDVAELARRGALGSVDWLDALELAEIRDLAGGASSELRRELERELLIG